MQLLKKGKTRLSALLLAMLFAMSAIGMPAVAHAAYTTNPTVTNSKNAACEGVGLVSGDPNCDGGADSEVNVVIGHVVNLLSVIVGIAAVVMIVVSGFRYITSGGEASSVAGAKNTLMYAIIGLVIVALAQFIVHFVLHQVN